MNRWAHVRRTADFVRHLRTRQVLLRGWLTAKRRLLARAAPVVPAIGRDLQRSPPPLRESLPEPLFRPRSFATVVDGELDVTFLNQRRLFRPPIPWHDPGVERAAHLWAMHLHYMEFLEDLDEAEFIAVVRDWIGANPAYGPAYWHAGWNSYSLSIRVVVWMQQIALRRDGLDEATLDQMIRSLAEQLRFLEDNLETDILGNHLIKNIKALLWAGRFFGGSEAARWRRIGENLLAQQLHEQILDDGMHYERSPSYHNQVFADLLECYAVGEPGPARDALGAALARMAQVTADLRHPDGLVPLFNDAGLTSAYAPADCLEIWQEVSGQTVRARERIILRDAGYWGLRSEDDLFILDCGPISPDFLVAHGHGDMLSFEWSVGGRRILVDQGVFQYDPGLNRATSRSTLSHNTVSIAGAEQCDFFGSFRCGRRARARSLAFTPTDDGFRFAGTHTGFDHLPGGARHERTFEVDHGRVIIDDRMIYPATEPTARLAFLLHPDCEICVDGRSAVICSGNVTITGVFEVEPTVEPARWWPDMGVEHNTRRLVLQVFGRDTHRSVFARG